MYDFRLEMTSVGVGISSLWKDELTLKDSKGEITIEMDKNEVVDIAAKMVELFNSEQIEIFAENLLGYVSQEKIADFVNAIGRSWLEHRELKKEFERESSERLEKYVTKDVGVLV